MRMLINRFMYYSCTLWANPKPLLPSLSMEVWKLLANFFGFFMLTSTTKKQGYPSVLKSAGIAPKSARIWSKFLSRRFFSPRIRPPLFECVSIGSTYASAFKSVGIGRMPFPALLKSVGTGLATLYPHSLPGSLKRREKKRRDRNFDPIPALFGAIPALLKTLG